MDRYLITPDLQMNRKKSSPSPLIDGEDDLGNKQLGDENNDSDEDNLVIDTR